MDNSTNERKKLNDQIKNLKKSHNDSAEEEIEEKKLECYELSKEIKRKRGFLQSFEAADRIIIPNNLVPNYTKKYEEFQRMGHDEENGIHISTRKRKRKDDPEGELESSTTNFGKNKRKRIKMNEDEKDKEKVTKAKKKAKTEKKEKKKRKEKEKEKENGNSDDGVVVLIEKPKKESLSPHEVIEID